MDAANERANEIAPARRSLPAANSSRDRHAGWRPWQSATVAILLLVSAGCTSWREYVANGFKVGPNYCRPAAPVADHWIDDRDPNVSQSPPNDAAWWRTFNDPVLDSLVQGAYHQNLTLRAAGLRILEARAQRGIAAGGLFPQSQQVYGDYTRTGLSKNTAFVRPNRFYDEWDVGASLFWELDFWGRFRRAVEAADARLDASIEDYDDVLVLLLAEVAQSYVELRTADQRLEYARKNVEIQRASLNLANVKFVNGATTRLDVTQGQTSLSQTEATIPPLEATRRQAANRLCILLGMPPGRLEETLANRLPGPIIPSAPPQVAVGIPADLLRRRPDIRRSERELAAQSAQIGIATSELYPHFSIAGTIYLDAANFSDLFSSGSWAGNVGPSFSWNVLNYGRLVNNIRVQDSRFLQQVAEYQNLVLQANAEAENSLVGFLKAQQQVASLQTSVTAGSDSLNLVQTQYNEGKTDFNRVFSVEQDLTRQQDQLAIAEGDVARNLILLYKALGGGWQIRLSGPEGQGFPAPAVEPSGEIVPAPAPVVPDAPPSPLPPP